MTDSEHTCEGMLWEGLMCVVEFSGPVNSFAILKSINDNHNRVFDQALNFF